MHLRAPVTALLARLFRAPLPAALRAGLLLAPGGEFAFVLVGAAGPMAVAVEVAGIFHVTQARRWCLTPGSRSNRFGAGVNPAPSAG